MVVSYATLVFEHSKSLPPSCLVWALICILNLHYFKATNNARNAQFWWSELLICIICQFIVSIAWGKHEKLHLYILFLVSLRRFLITWNVDVTITKPTPSLTIIRVGIQFCSSYCDNLVCLFVVSMLYCSAIPLNVACPSSYQLTCEYFLNMARCQFPKNLVLVDMQIYGDWWCLQEAYFELLSLNYCHCLTYLDLFSTSKYSRSNNFCFRSISGLWHIVFANILSTWTWLPNLWSQRIVEGIQSYAGCYLLLCYSKLITTELSFPCSVQPETLVDHIKFDHGYTAKSPAIVNVCTFFLCLEFNTYCIDGWICILWFILFL